MSTQKIQRESWNLLPWDALSRDDIYCFLQLRQEVFIVEQNCPYLDADGKDDQALHLQGKQSHRLFAYARVFPPQNHNMVVIGRVIVHPSARGKGKGYTLMEKAHELSRLRYPSCSFFLSAQSHLSSFYGRLGYQQCGEGYLEDNIPHIPMEKLE